MAKRFSELIYGPSAEGEAASKAETHTPKIRAPSTVKKGEPVEIVVEVGPHPNQAQHSIRRIEVWFSEEGRPFNPVRIASIELEPGVAEPRVTVVFKPAKSGAIHALAYCNLHGVWEAVHEIRVEE